MDHSLSHGGRIANYTFADSNNRACTLHDSSSRDDVWLGLDVQTSRMLLSRAKAAELVLLLQHFIEHGRLPKKTTRIADVPAGKWVNHLLVLGDGKLGESHGREGMKVWSFEQCGYSPNSQVAVSDLPPTF